MHAMFEPAHPGLEPPELPARSAQASPGPTTWIPSPEAPIAPWWIPAECTCPDDCRIDHENA